MPEEHFSEKTGKAGVITASNNADDMEDLTHAVVDDMLYNIVHDLLLKVHQDEKMARANSAAIRVEKLAYNISDTAQGHEISPDVEAKTESAVYKDGSVTLIGNPLKTTTEILCRRCHLPRLLYPTDGKGAKRPDPSVIYCKRHPPIRKPGFDIYGQTWVGPGPGRGNKKEKKLDANGELITPVKEKQSAKDRPPNVLNFPSATCAKCKRCILVTRLNNHMGSCIGNSGRATARNAAQKLNGSQKDDNSPAGSQKGTPGPPDEGLAGAPLPVNGKKGGVRAMSPRKRDSDEFDRDRKDTGDNSSASDVAENPKKKLKLTGTGTLISAPKKLILKTGKSSAPGKRDNRVRASSSLNVETKANGEEAEEGKSKHIKVKPFKDAKLLREPKQVKMARLSKEPENGEDATESYGTPTGKKRRSIAGTPTSVNGGEDSPPKRKKGSVTAGSKMPATKKKWKLNTTKPPVLLPPNRTRGKAAKDSEAQSESSGTLSSPP